MRQYYIGVFMTGDGEIINPYSQRDIGCLKLMEHSWWKNPYPNWFCHELFYTPKFVAWVGDYSEATGCPEKIFETVWRNHTSRDFPIAYDSEFTLNHLYLLNYTKKEYLNCSKYYAAVNGKDEMGNGWVPHPLPLLTAMGNGQGGDDYRGVNMDKIGRWAGDLLHVTMLPPRKDVGFTELDVEFYEPPRTKKK